MTDDQRQAWDRLISSSVLADLEDKLLVMEPELARALHAEIGRLEAELAQARTTPPAPVAVVEDEDEELHGFKDKDDAIRFVDGNDNRTVRLWGSDGWHWHPAEKTGDAG